MNIHKGNVKMKINVFVLILILFMLNAYGNESKMNIGISGGPNYTDLNYNELFSAWESTEHQYNLNVFTLVEYNFNKYVSMQTGLRYSIISNKVNIDQSIYPDPIPDEFQPLNSFSVSHKVLNLPIFFKYNFPFLRYSYILSGIEIGYLLSSSMINNYADGEEEIDDIQTNTTRLNLTIDIGVGFEKDIGIVNLFTSLIYSHGVINIPKENKWAVNWKTKELYLLFGFKYMF